MKLAGDKTYEFPALLICPKEWFDVEKASDLGLSQDALLYSLSFLHDLYPLRVSNYSAAKAEFVSFYEHRGYGSLLEYYKAISVDLEYETKNATSVSSYSCRGCERRLAEVTILEQKFCYVFRLDPVERGLGVYSGTRSVKINLRVKSELFVPASEEWLVYFNPFLDVLFSIYPVLTVRTFFHNVIQFNMQRYFTLDSPESPCYSSSTPSDYLSVTCMARCHNDLYRERVGCGFLWLSDSRLPPTAHCNTLNKVQLRNRTLQEFYASEDNAEIDATAADLCVRKCPRKCNRVASDTSLQIQQRFSESEMRQAMESNLTVLDLSIKHAAVYQGGVMELREIDTYTVTQLVNNIGGTLGLFVGGTLMTFAQLILFLIDYLLARQTETGGRRSYDLAHIT